MKKFVFICALALVLSVLGNHANAALTPVGGNMTVSAHAKAGSQMDVFDNNSATTTVSGFVSAMAMSDDMGDIYDPGDPGDPGDFGDPGIPPFFPMPGSAMADAMSDASIYIRADGFALAGNGHSGVSNGPGHSDISVQLNFMFSLDEASSCAIIADNNWDWVVGTEAVSASLYLADSTGQKLLELTQPMSHYEGTLLLDAGQYSVVGDINCITIAEYSSFGTIWDGSGMFGIDLTATAVPEPLTLSLLGLGGVLMLRKRK